LSPDRVTPLELELLIAVLDNKDLARALSGWKRVTGYG
jgi:hypothetical protein